MTVSVLESEVAREPSYCFQASVDNVGPQIVGGKGVRIDVEKDGKIYQNILDGITGAAVGALGWKDEEIFEVVNKAVRESTYSYAPLISNKASEELAKFYIDNSPKGVFSAALWLTSGSESNENALRIIRQYYLERGLPEKVKLISRENSYHGFTLGALGISSNPRVEPYKPYIMDQESVALKMPCAYTYRFKKDSETEEGYAQRLLDILEKKILDNGPEKVAAVIVETLPGSSLGTTPPPKGYLKGIRHLCNKYDIIFYLDEVMCGTGRSNPNGKLNCWENFLDASEGPDIQTVGKTLGSGYVTIAGVLIGPKIKEAFVNGSNSINGGNTYSSHEFSCAVALGVQKKIARENLTANIFEMGNLLAAKLRQRLVPEDNIVGDVRGVGGFQSVEFVKNKETKEVFDPKLNIITRFKNICFENGLIIMGMPSNPDGSCGDRAIFAPSFIVTEADINEMVDIFVRSVNDFSKTLRQEGAW
ncbi:hypothetical protein BZL39_C08750 [Zygosaccharomyces parabailii]|uniref:BN860_00364g1_1 n=1 Tax=Zygosaccharomyces bailii (strain CLIB 213 / ATCC 58445 / CBS 680 / BCRC 21525 / NBRC 1098 / NCYC 1416 / NRRL Y-2227) TaxID=1333698 RepID=A0A8J2X482_ZYGB2|nr:hypothetical protein BZL39_C08750 [Zygosaccharomyces parabailii]CDF87172.1 BN860_00364g1_1 [Zygosaccharomyces bailii CLIB 213]CDH15762.1 related to ornithine aminotransferase [Zygosaccharomyces bailii ISA1307]SJM88176.1 related to ornithine aminotransferase [Zygosaccharomyces bailii]